MKPAIPHAFAVQDIATGKLERRRFTTRSAAFMAAGRIGKRVTDGWSHHEVGVDRQGNAYDLITDPAGATRANPSGYLLATRYAA